MKYPLVSIIIPFYKKINYFKKTYNSILKQSYKNIEIIIIYDDQNKNDLKKLKKIINKDTKIIINTKNIGAGVSRNKGIQKAKGKYIAFIDSDDLWKKNKLKTQIIFMEKNNVKITHTSYILINKKNKTIGYRKAKKILTYKMLLFSCDIGLSTVVIEKSLMKKYKFPPIKTKEDFVLWLKISKNVKIVGINKLLVKWRKLDNSLSSNIIQKLKDGYIVYKKYMKFNFFKSLIYLSILSLNFLFKKYSEKWN